MSDPGCLQLVGNTQPSDATNNNDRPAVFTWMYESEFQTCLKPSILEAPQQRWFNFPVMETEEECLRNAFTVLLGASGMARKLVIVKFDMGIAASHSFKCQFDLGRNSVWLVSDPPSKKARLEVPRECFTWYNACDSHYCTSVLAGKVQTTPEDMNFHTWFRHDAASSTTTVDTNDRSCVSFVYTWMLSSTMAKCHINGGLFADDSRWNNFPVMRSEKECLYNAFSSVGATTPAGEVCLVKFDVQKTSQLGMTVHTVTKKGKTSCMLSTTKPDYDTHLFLNDSCFESYISWAGDYVKSIAISAPNNSDDADFHTWLRKSIPNEEFRTDTIVNPVFVWQTVDEYGKRSFTDGLSIESYNNAFEVMISEAKCLEIAFRTLAQRNTLVPIMIVKIDVHEAARNNLNLWIRKNLIDQAEFIYFMEGPHNIEGHGRTLVPNRCWTAYSMDQSEYVIRLKSGLND